jgi:hypothetical protein
MEQYFLDASQDLMGQTICHKDSKLLSWDTFNIPQPKDGESYQENDAISILILRLLYLAIHIHQHHHAIPEAKHRSDMSAPCRDELLRHNVGEFDFECPRAKFLVVPMKHRGLGAVMRTDVAPALMAGVATGRVVLFLNGLADSPSYLQAPWSWASCPRHDKQCFFLPDSPCVVTYEDLQNATTLERGERRRLFKNGQMPPHAHDSRVVVMDMATRPQRTPPNLRKQLVDILNEHVVLPLLSRQNHSNDPRLAFITKAMDYLQQDEDEAVADSSFGYYGKNFAVHRAMILYAMRPNLEYAMRLEHTVQQVFVKPYNTPNTMVLGLPIRASDKCVVESECAPFDLYMDLMGTTWERHKFNSPHHPTNVNIVLTSESPDIHQARHEYQARNRSSFPMEVSYNFVTNDFDSVQNSGDPKALNSNVTKEEILLSTLGSLKMQLHSEYVVGNCCSNHHLMLVDLLRAGCGAHHHDDVAQCMQDHDDPKYRLCCAWTKTPECLEKRERALDIGRANRVQKLKR